MNDLSATYSPEDNKLRLYPLTRLPEATYRRVKEAGFTWAPRQELFVAPAWTPDREDLLMDLCGEIGDEDTSLVERAEQRAERFEGYHDRRLDDAEGARRGVEAITSGIPLGQPILVGHHSEKHARKDAERIENGMRKAVKLWETAEYWTSRAAGALRHAKYKERPDVRARRIKTLEADERKFGRDKDTATRCLAAWTKIFEPGYLKGKDRELTDKEKALYLANVASREHSLYSDLSADRITPAEARDRALATHRRVIAWADRWLFHLANRLVYERALLAESGYTPPPKPKTKAALPLLNYPGPVSYRAYGNVTTAEATPMTKAEYAKIHTDYKGTWVSADGTHRIRTAMLPGHKYGPVYLTDAKTHERPGAEVVAAKKAEEDAAALARADAKARAMLACPAYEKPEPTPFDAMREQLRAGVQVVSAPQLFPTPPELARKMADLAGSLAGCRVLEPSAGTGNLVRAIVNNATGFDCVRVVAVEINHALVGKLEEMRQTSLYANASNFEIRQGDFLECNGDLGTFHRIVMNPPFENGADVQHIRHALTMLKPGGRLVALCANGPRQREAFHDTATVWEDLPDGSFAAEGTNVRVALLVLERPAE